VFLTLAIALRLLRGASNRNAPGFAGGYLLRLIRSDLRLNVFGELFPVPPEAMLEYVVATIDVKEQKLKLFLGSTQIEEFAYQLR
jgi:hypothetical protein